MLGERSGDGGGRLGGFATGKAVGEEGEGAWGSGGEFEAGIELVSIGSGEGYFLGGRLIGGEEAFEGVECLMVGEVFP